MRRVAIVLVCLALVVVITACYFYFHHTGPIPPGAVGSAPSLISLLPQQAPFVIYADVATLRKSAFLEQLVALVPAPAEDPEYSEFVRSTGFDYSRDLDQVGISILPTTPQPTIWAVADGRFDQQRIAAYALRTGKSQQRDRHTVYLIPNSQGGEIALSFPSANRIQLISNPNGKTSTDAPKPKDDVNSAAMSERIRNVAASSIFAVVRMDAVPKNVTLGTVSLDQVASFLQNVQWLSLSAVPDGQNLKVVLDGKCDSSIHAANLQLALQGFKFMGRAMLTQSSVRKQFTPQGADALSKLIVQIDISRGEQSVALSSALTPALLTGLAAPPPQARRTPPAKSAAPSSKTNH